jgi:hypothetical protein
MACGIDDVEAGVKKKKGRFSVKNEVIPSRKHGRQVVEFFGPDLLPVGKESGRRTRARKCKKISF